MSAARPPMVIAGGGECAAKAALGLRKHGWVGDIVLVGDEPMIPYERPPLTKAVLSGAQDQAPRPHRLDQFEDAGVTLRLGEQVSALDPGAHTVTVGGEEVSYAALLLATGARPRLLTLPGVPAGRIFTVRTEADALALRDRLTPGARVLVVGAGFIGLEVAAVAAARGCSVDVVEVTPRVLSRAVPTELSEPLARRHAAAGVRLHLATSIVGAESAGVGGVAVELSDGERIEADVVVAGIGVQPRVEVAEAAGLAVDDGIVVDDVLATSAPDVYAAGDCAALTHPLFPGRPARFESWRLALEGGVQAAKSMLGQRDSFHAVPWFWTDQFDLTLQLAGLTRDVAASVLRQDEGGTRWHGFDDDGRVVAVGVVGTPRAVVRDLRRGEQLIAARATPDPASLGSPA